MSLKSEVGVTRKLLSYFRFRRVNKMEPMFVRNYETDIEAAYLFNKKRLIKVLAGWGIGNWKEFLKCYC